jgi:hypothetical protein
MTEPVPFRYSARAALRAAWDDLWRWPTVTLFALVAAATGALAGRAGWLRARHLLTAAVAPSASPAPASALVRAVGVLVAGAAVGALLVDVAVAAALCAYAGPPPPARRGRLWPPLWRGLARTPAMITVRAVELFLYSTLAFGDLLVVSGALIHSDRVPSRQALLATAALAPSLLLASWTFAAARVAQTLVARGLSTAPALVHGLDLTLRRFASLARLGLLAWIVTAPLWISAALLPAAAAAPLWVLAALWPWAALARLVGRDPRLCFG